MINQTIQTTIEIAKANAYNSSLVTLWLSFVVFLPISFLFFRTKNTNWGRLVGIWLVSTILSAIVLIFLTVSPELISNTIIKLKSFSP